MRYISFIAVSAAILVLVVGYTVTRNNTIVALQKPTPNGTGSPTVLHESSSSVVDALVDDLLSESTLESHEAQLALADYQSFYSDTSTLDGTLTFTYEN